MAEAESLETAAEHERILREIESTDTACIGPTLRYPGYRDRRRAGTRGTGTGSFGFVCDWLPAGPMPAHPFGETRWRPASCARRVSLRSPDVGSLPGRRCRSASYSVGSVRLLQAGTAFVLPQRLSPAPGNKRSPDRWWQIFPLGTSSFSLRLKPCPALALNPALQTKQDFTPLSLG